MDYCNMIGPDLFIKEVDGFGRGGSIRSLMVHINNSYQYWTGTHCLGRERIFNEYSNFTTLQSCMTLYERTDELVIEVINTFSDRMYEKISRDKFVASPFEVFSHVITHEYHHKGQILTISRLLGYTPVDTDILR